MISLVSETPSCDGESALRWVKHQAFDLFKPVPRLSPTEWANQFRILSKESSFRPGRFDSTIAPYQVEPMDSVLDETVERVVLMWASQTGKTETINNIVGFHIDWKPSPILVLQPTLEMAETWSKDRLVPMLRDTPRMRGKVQDPRSRDSNNTILHKRFPGGHVTACGANSAASLASRPIRVVICDEVDRYPMSAGTEGDPVALAYKRADTFADSVLFMTSTPTIKGASRIEREFELTDKRHFFVPCPKCNHYQILNWHQVKWPDDQPDKAYLECSGCQAQLSDKERIQMVQKGEWRPTAPYSGKRGYHINGVYSPFPSKKGFKNRLHQMAVEFLDAKAKGSETLKVWTNTFLAETWEEEAQAGPDPELIFARRENYSQPNPEGGEPITVLPEKCVVLVAFGDVQQDRVEVGIVGAGEGEELWVIEHRSFKGNIERWDVWDEVDQFIQKKYQHPLGAELKPYACGFDTGHKSKIVQAFVKRCRPRLVYATKGIGTSGIPWVTRSRKQPILLLKVNTAKEAIYSRLNLEQHGPGYIHLPMTVDLEFCRQMVSERVVTRFRFGMPVKTFEEHGRNEALDILVGSMAMLDLVRPNYKKLAERLKPAEVIETDPNSDIVLRPPRPRMNKTGKKWMSGFGKL